MSDQSDRGPMMRAERMFSQLWTSVLTPEQKASQPALPAVMWGLQDLLGLKRFPADDSQPSNGNG